MTAKQKANQARFKKVVAEAKKLRKKNPKLTQAQAVKQAWAIMYSKKRAGVGEVKKTKYKYEVYNGGDELMGTYDEKDRAISLMYYLIKNGFEEPYYVKYKGKIIKEQKIGAVKKKAAKKKSSSYHKDNKSHNVNIRVVSGWKKGKTKFVEKGEKAPKRNAVKVNRTKSGSFKKFVRIGNVATYKDPIAAREIALYADNDYMLYKQRKEPILKNLSKKHKKGTFDIEKAAKLWRYYIDAAMQKYHKEFGSKGDKWYDLLEPSDRQLLALEYAKEAEVEFNAGNYNE